MAEFGSGGAVTVYRRNHEEEVTEEEVAVEGGGGGGEGRSEKEKAEDYSSDEVRCWTPAALALEWRNGQSSPRFRG